MTKILDRGFVVLEDIMGDDMTIVNAARVSFRRKSSGDEQDKKLLFYLMRNRHMTPFEMVEFRFHVKCPLFVARQWMRHRTWSYNETSRRYTDSEIEFYVPDAWRRQAGSNKQCSSETDCVSGNYSDQLRKIIDDSVACYCDAINNGVAREQARMFLPQAMYTEFIAKTDVRNLMHFLSLRMAPDAQYEMQLYARAVFEFFGAALPWTAEAYTRESQAVTFSI